MANYEKLLTPLTLKHGAVLKNRIAMAPMVAQSTGMEGRVSKEDLDFYRVRSGAAGMLITGATNVSASSIGFDFHLSIADDSMIEGLSQLAEVMKKDGNKAIIQLFHTGQATQPALQVLGETVAPVGINNPRAVHWPKITGEDRVDRLIEDFGEAARRAILAGFDGVEIHGANRHLLQQFFSPHSNHREDKWGGSFENRMRFPLAVVYEVNRVILRHAPSDFIIGYRFSPEEFMDNEVGYTIEDSLLLIDTIANYGLDYIHTSLFTGYWAKPVGYDKSYGQLVKETVGDRAATIIVSNIFTADDALDALNHGDIAAIGREALIEPHFAQKILEGKANTIKSELHQGDIEGLKFSQVIKDWFIIKNRAVPPLPGAENLRQ